jgi:rubrerythrin
MNITTQDFKQKVREIKKSDDKELKFARHLSQAIQKVEKENLDLATSNLSDFQKKAEMSENVEKEIQGIVEDVKSEIPEKYLEHYGVE